MNIVACTGDTSDAIAAARRGSSLAWSVMLRRRVPPAGRPAVDWWGFHLRRSAVAVAPHAARRSAAERVGPTDGPRSAASGWWLIAIGVWGLLTEYRLFGFGYGDAGRCSCPVPACFVIWRALDPAERRRLRDEGAATRERHPSVQRAAGVSDHAAARRSDCSIVFVGIVFTLDELGLAGATNYLRYWPIGDHRSSAS